MWEKDELIKYDVLAWKSWINQVQYANMKKMSKMMNKPSTICKCGNNG
jgi:hypothetical protein